MNNCSGHSLFGTKSRDRSRELCLPFERLRFKMGNIRWIGTLAFATVVQSAFAGSVHGVLVSADGTPIAKAHLETTYVKASDPRDRVEVTYAGDTGTDGSFTLPDLPEDPTAAAPIPLMVHLPDGSLTIASLESDGQKIVPTPQSALTLKTAAPDGKPQAGVNIVVTAVSWSRPGRDHHYYALFRPTTSGWTRRTDSTGSLVFKGLPGKAAVDFRAEAPGYVLTQRRATLLAQGSCSDTFAMMGAAVLTGRVLAEGKPVPGLKVRAYCNDPWDPKSIGWSQTHQDEATTDAAGRYRLTQAPTGKVQLELDLGSLASEWATKNYADLKVSKGQEISELNFALDKGVVVRGHVLTTEGRKPVAQAEVFVTVGRDVNVTVTTDASGAFQARVPAGQLYVAVQNVKGERVPQNPVWETMDAEHNPPLDLRVPDASVLPPIPHLSGIVQTPDGKPVAGALVENLKNPGSVRTDATGHFQFPEAINPTSVIVASTQDAVTGTPILITDQSSVTLSLYAKPVSIEGTLVGEDGKPLPGVDVTFCGQYSRGVSRFSNTTTDAKGVYRIQHEYLLDTYFTWMKKNGYGSATQQNFHLSSGESKRFEPMTMVPADGVIEGHVLQLNGKPAVHAYVTAQTQESEGVFTDEKGYFRLTNVSRGKHWIAAGSQNSLWKPEEASTGDKYALIYLPPPPKDAPGAVMENRTGQDAPTLHIDQWVGGQKLDVASLKGKVVVIDFWAIWCHPCVEDLPKVEALAKKYEGKGVVVVGVHAPGTALKDVTAFIKKQGLTYFIGMDPKDKSGMGLNHVTFGPTGIPHVVVIDAKGVVQSDSYEIDDAAKVVAKLVDGK